jgi:hypothetical protein
MLHRTLVGFERAKGEFAKTSGEHKPCQPECPANEVVEELDMKPRRASCAKDAKNAVLECGAGTMLAWSSPLWAVLTGVTYEKRR